MRFLALATTVIAVVMSTELAHAGWCEQKVARKCIDILVAEGIDADCENSRGPGKEIGVPASKVQKSIEKMKRYCPKVSAQNSQ